MIGIVVAKKSLDEYGNVSYSSYKSMPPDIMKAAKERLSLEESEYNTVDWWLTWKYVPDGATEADETCAPDFKQMNEAYYDLYDDEKRTKLIETICTQIAEYSKAIK